MLKRLHRAWQEWIAFRQGAQILEQSEHGLRSPLVRESPGQPAPALCEWALATAAWPARNEIALLQERTANEPTSRVNQRPGEHYRFLAGLVHAYQPRTTVAIGTYHRAGAPGHLCPTPGCNRSDLYRRNP